MEGQSYLEYLLAKLLRNGTLHPAPAEIKLAHGHAAMTITIGNDHTATVIIDSEALDALQRRAGAIL